MSSINTKDQLRYSTGRARDGSSFKVPETYDMVRSLFDPTLPKSISDYFTLLCLTSVLGLYWITPQKIRTVLFIALYLFWRLGYNVGLGYLLYNQSKYEMLFRWYEKYTAEGTSHTLIARLIALELKQRLGDQVKQTPLEFKTWLVYRSLVNLILMMDFTTYMGLVLACSSHAFDQAAPLVILRWTLGVAFFVFNLIVKLDAHKIVKDYAWYWGDFFFRLQNNEELIFDGVFDLAPHPMYSIGYAGYYGFALMTKSYTVFFVSVLGHFLQFVFLEVVESPHIEKIYGSGDANSEALSVASRDLEICKEEGSRPMTMLQNFDPLRSADYLTLALVAYTGVFPFFLPNTPVYESLLFAAALVVKLVGSLLVNSVLYYQSRFKSWTKHFIRNSALDMDVTANSRRVEMIAFKNWILCYNNLTLASYSSLFVLAVRSLVYGPVEWTNWFILKLVLTTALVAAQYLINTQILESIGVFGWFYGDFFMVFEESKKQFLRDLSRTGIYRYLNNPERVSSVLTVWAFVALFEHHRARFLALAVVYTVNNIVLLNFVEKPHMVKLYGESNVTHKSGIERSINQLFIPPKVQGELVKMNGSLDRLIADTSKIIDAFMKKDKGNDQVLNLKLIKTSQNDLTIIDSVDVERKPGHLEPILELVALQEDSKLGSKFYVIGEEIHVRWTQDSTEDDEKSWIGLYKFLETSSSRDTTRVSSKGHWAPIHPAGYPLWAANHEGHVFKDSASTGEVVFKSDIVYFEPGVYEFRMHSGGSHRVTCTSSPFELRLPELQTLPLIGSSDEDVRPLANEIHEKLVSKVFGTRIPDCEFAWAGVLSSKENAKRVQTLATLLQNEIKIEITKTRLIMEPNLLLLVKKIVTIRALIDALDE
ncbi:unnamed protein product [Kuraishia capsulata CBS 1993]|uniref:Phosphatidylethanolamine N-methyltransferase n=1 Tax=Kuraishia capsulata CBS 1993 TaxID=1382522 RepID=W6MQB6_9ASCO|nr:uncharacterized protein KUCA_T00003440001 [Kuraishia capsulata CBS 1993]CDK27462.1 unnamed protein product [Kuraishia capsulata CBS 1993]